MANNQFQGSLYRTQRAMLDAIAYAWVGGGGEARLGDFDEVANEALAADCIAGWRLDLPEQGWPGDEETPSHMAEQDYDENDLSEAFARLRGLLASGGS